MIRARLLRVSARRDDALDYLTKALDSKEWEGWVRSSDITLTEKRPAFKTPTWAATVTMTRDEVVK